MLKDIKLHTNDGQYFIYHNCLNDCDEQALEEIMYNDFLYLVDGITHQKIIIKTDFIHAIEIGKF
jgi:hypothetical protein